MERRHYMIAGRVQGVGYRYFTRQAAQRLGLTGWVRNLGDGSVEAEIQGDAAALDACEKVLHQGPPLGHVTGVRVQARPLAEGETGFAIRH